ncbi:thiamine-phosphate kinase [Solemya velum gill symbiont]|uniref:Thiamine-monophosphate kinase n=1 Tax=Solemya velum gill symbiont TaxID=2340 RepID=A0A0B0H6Y5_SOVGS|nr:thiamine-phosphate kinase [Solemya velum gill symbiont]KHF25948.1 thiamine-phosphate kinase [Solemya velum gill symbiont]OOY34463.1 thiamine-phosphate kinase [Solemya velum gill symbiont]OOY37175.1 thiamine-phosphate kinase [Solemya velum gill symbiont]OOY41189.1 thiamine-phosphate kinase [Solemya velum gill symbiont]OOY43188.1 thiamine-phosphate kinase [Solemya velum gill symbiont]
MSSSEFDLIESILRSQSLRRDDVTLGIGDDCALLDVPQGMELAVSLDTLVSGRHFFPDAAPELIGHKVLAVNLSDLAAMGAEPAWVTMGLTLPDADEEWLAGFMRGFSALSSNYGVQLVGGDTTSGPLTVSLQVHGLVPAGKAIRRSGARPGDLVFVSHTIGDAGLALAMLQGRITPTDELQTLRQRLESPQPRIELGIALREVATAAIDLSDGLASDLGHICERSQCGAVIETHELPLSDAVRTLSDWRLAVSAGDDYELCFTIDSSRQERVTQLSKELDLRLTCIGKIRQQPGIDFLSSGGSCESNLQGYDHFPESDS